MIIDPWGKVIARASDRVDTIVADIDWDYLEDVRAKIPSLKNRVDLQEM
jgi:predicted amidohydrolase